MLGAGGVAGIAFHAGVLAAVSEATGFDPRQVDLVVGTSAGSVTAAGLRAGVSSSDLYARVTDGKLSAPGRALFAAVDAASGGGRPMDRLGRLRPLPAAPGVLWSAGRSFGRVRPGALLAGLLPAGRTPTDAISRGTDALLPAWPEMPTWVCAVRLDDGRRVVFGRSGAPPASLGQAVAASCAIPGYFAPVVVDGTRYVDGGAHSTSNLAVVADRGFDLVIVSAPMSRAGRRPAVPGALPAVLGLVGREVNRVVLASETRRVRSGGTEVVAFAPTTADRAVMGLNPMDMGRRGPVARQAYESALRRLERDELQARLGALERARRSPL
ncbi:MAG TPA: patatin-like phospholipase family protein [Acidimicrobiales bacterium]|nr:patatin-like phospholipase family protein [Acidimicrobiales bacterium]